MMMSKVVLTLLLSQYVRSRVVEDSQTAQCLWWQESTVIEIRQSVAGNAETPGDTEFQAFSAAMKTWTNQLDKCASISLREGPRTETRNVGFFMGQTNENVVVYRLRRCTDFVSASDVCHKSDAGEQLDCGSKYDCWDHQRQALAVTTTSFNPDSGRIIDSDIEFNTPSFIFTTVDSPPCVNAMFSTSCVASDVQNTSTHELGHLLGLAHSFDSASTMVESASPGELSKRVLDSDSAQFVCDVYPVGQPSKACNPGSGSKLTNAVGSSCQAIPGGLLAVAAMWLFGRRRRP